MPKMLYVQHWVKTAPNLVEFCLCGPIYNLQPHIWPSHPYYISQSRSQMKFSAAMYQSATQLGLLLLKNGKMCENGYPYLSPCPFKLSISIPKYLIVFECCNTNTFSLCQSDRRHLRYVYVGPTIGMANNSPEKANAQNNSFFPGRIHVHCSAAAEGSARNSMLNFSIETLVTN